MRFGQFAARKVRVGQLRATVSFLESKESLTPKEQKELESAKKLLTKWGY